MSLLALLCGRLSLSLGRLRSGLLISFFLVSALFGEARLTSGVGHFYLVLLLKFTFTLAFGLVGADGARSVLGVLILFDVFDGHVRRNNRRAFGIIKSLHWSAR